MKALKVERTEQSLNVIENQAPVLKLQKPPQRSGPPPVNPVGWWTVLESIISALSALRANELEREVGPNSRPERIARGERANRF